MIDLSPGLHNPHNCCLNEQFSVGFDIFIRNGLLLVSAFNFVSDIDRDFRPLVEEVLVVRD